MATVTRPDTVTFTHRGREVTIEFQARGLLRTYRPGCEYTRYLLRKDRQGDIEAMCELEAIYDRALALRNGGT